MKRKPSQKRDFYVSLLEWQVHFIPKFSGVGAVAEKVAAFAVTSFLLLVESLIFC